MRKQLLSPSRSHEREALMKARIDAGTADFTPLGKYREAVDGFIEQLADADEFHRRKTGALTPRFIDEPQTAGYRPYFFAHAHISGAVEHFDVLWNLITGEDGITPRAPYSLMRPIFEHGFWAQWALDPDQSLTRRQRGLTGEVLDRKSRKNWAEVYDLEPEAVEKMRASHEKVMEVYRQEAAATHLPWKRASEKPNLVLEIPRLAAVRKLETELGSMYVGAWRILSGLNHGALFALQVVSDLSDEREVEKGAHVQVSVGDDWFMFNARLSFSMMIEAMRLYIARSTITVK